MNSLLSKTFALIFFISLSAIISCNDDEIVYPKGGYPYPKYVDAKDTTFYCYPLKNIKSTKDSFETANFYPFLQEFDEYNLSLGPGDKPTFRLIYFDMSTVAIITLKPEQIIVKKLIKGSPGWHDTLKLSQQERFHFDILERFFPLNDTSYKTWKKAYLDSLSSAYPELLDPNYYQSLLDKSISAKKKFQYSLKIIPITKKSFTSLVKQINESGYWKLPFDNWCEDVPTDASSFILESNTLQKYNIVQSVSCPDDTTNYIKACQELINYAGMEKEIELIWNGGVTTGEPVKVRELKLTEVKEEPVPKSKKKKPK